MELVHEFTFTAELREPVSVGAGPYGDRTIFEMLSGEVTGERIRGKMGTGGADWILAPRLETGDERYAWVNQTVFIADGRVHPGPTVEYRVHRVT
jgi:hypothetical protein